MGSIVCRLADHDARYCVDGLELWVAAGAQPRLSAERCGCLEPMGLPGPRAFSEAQRVLAGLMYLVDMVLLQRLQVSSVWFIYGSS